MLQVMGIAKLCVLELVPHRSGIEMTYILGWTFRNAECQGSEQSL